MNESNQKERMIQAIGGMLMAFPSSSNIKHEASVSMYLMAVDGISPEAVVMACKAFVRGEIADASVDFAPSAPRLAKEAKEIGERLSQDAFWDKTEFVTFDSPEWRALCRHRGHSMPQVERNGISGWYVAKDEIEALPPQIVAEERMLIERADRRMAAPALTKMEQGHD